MPKLQVRGTAFLWSACILAGLAASAGPAAAAADPLESDVRQVRVGATLDDKSAAGLAGFSCAAGDGAELADWSDYRRCPADARGLRGVRFEFQENKTLARMADRWEGTKIAGHPVILTMAVSDAGTIEALHIVTDEKASPYLRKKAFLLSLRVREHYGTDGWACTDLPRQTGETEIGACSSSRSAARPSPGAA
ncbi:hypothetical protein [Skermanella pratensis]|uniref:hypothetical protein n=1 Tax=Skermanella pratensis TaxID=2233999 RepID=UPI001301709D|nr:hypothetical protein [Skermanella pratensis]